MKLRRKIPRCPKITPDMVCNCGKPATDLWWSDSCALREAGVAPSWRPVCAECDLSINEHGIRTLYGDQYEREIADYRARRIGRVSKEPHHDE